MTTLAPAQHAPVPPRAARPSRVSLNLQLFAVCVAIWGSTWMAIKFQLGHVAPEASVAWRFGLAALLLVGVCRVRGETLRFDWRTHRELLLLGAFMFCSGYVFVYHAERYLVSGLVAVGYTASPLLNLVASRVAFGARMSRRVAAGGVLGVVGIVLVFLPEFAQVRASVGFAWGAAFTMLGVVSASVGNVFAARVSARGLSVWQKMAWGMAYGAAGSLLAALLTGQPVGFDATWPYVLSLGYLALFGSVFAFAAYLTLLARTSAAVAGYTGVMVPVVALVLSSLFEHFEWQALTFVGVAIAIAGNLLVLKVTNR